MPEHISLRFFTRYEISQAAIFITYGNKNLLIDPGQRNLQNGKEALIADFNVPSIDYLLITHYHGDHANLLDPILNNRYFHGKILCHKATAEILRAYNAKVRIKPGTFIDLDYGQTFPLDDRANITLFNSGHVLGSAMLYLQINDKRLLISGDMGAQYLPLVQPPDKKLPTEPLDLLIIDGKNANHVRNWDLQKNPYGEILYQKLAECFLYDEGNVLMYVPMIQIPPLIYCLNYIFHTPEYHDFHTKIERVFIDPEKSVVKPLLEIFKRYHDLLDQNEREYIPYWSNCFHFKKLEFANPKIETRTRSLFITANHDQFAEWFEELRTSEKNDVLLLYQKITHVLKGKINLIDEKCKIRFKRMPFLHLHPDQKELKHWYKSLQQHIPIKKVLFYHYDNKKEGNEIHKAFKPHLSESIYLAHDYQNKNFLIQAN